MPLPVFKRLGIRALRPSSMTLQLAGRSTKRPQGVIDDILVKVGDFCFSVDFVVLEMEEDKKFPLILGCPFMATARAIIDVEAGSLAFELVVRQSHLRCQ